MKCSLAVREMRLTMSNPTMSSRGVRISEFQCERCGDTERRFVFDPSFTRLPSLGTT